MGRTTTQQVKNAGHSGKCGFQIHGENCSPPLLRVTMPHIVLVKRWGVKPLLVMLASHTQMRALAPAGLVLLLMNTCVLHMPSAVPRALYGCVLTQTASLSLCLGPSCEGGSGPYPQGAHSRGREGTKALRTNRCTGSGGQEESCLGQELATLHK